jgi:hypothetical protein
MKRHMKRISSGAFIFFLGLSVALASGCAARVGVYDSDHGDYHHWDAHEDRAYHNYWTESHGREPYRDFGKLNANEQKDYWNWRHSHPDDKP